MRLSKIKLSGFKTFVEPAVIDIAEDLTGIVGPNGCGKSNIIDALLWVLGESSARHLRGDSLVDVIFNGSSRRKPVGRASVELLFDNSTHRLRGRYASYDEVSVRRQLSRDGVSSFFLNGTRCRRRDITELFLGTGLGPRSYAIIEQGTVSRLIEAKPDELRIFVEEAAGVSRYRQMRKEAQGRITHAKENINRVNDIRSGLESQLDRLGRQLKSAEQYREYKAQERMLQAEYLALGWRDLQKIAQEQHRVLSRQETEYEAAVAALRATEAELEEQRLRENQANRELGTAQSDYYQASAKISRLEQEQRHVGEKKTAWEQERGEGRVQIAQMREEQGADRQKLHRIEAEMTVLQPRLELIRSDSDKVQKLLDQAESTWGDWQLDWDAWSRNESELQRERQTVQTQLDFMLAEQQRQEVRTTALQQERASLPVEEDKSELAALCVRCQTMEADISRDQDVAKEAGEAVRGYREELRQMTLKLDQARSRSQELRGHLRSLSTLQQARRGSDQAVLDAWLQVRGLDGHKPLVELLDIEPEWIEAMEIVASGFLHYLWVDAPAPVLDQFDDAPEQVGLVTAGIGTLPAAQWPRLLDRVRNQTLLPQMLAFVYTADCLEDALRIRPELSAYESVVTRQGVWVGSNWIFSGSGQGDGGVLRREQEMARLREKLEQEERHTQGMEQHQEQIQERLLVAERKQEDCQTRLQVTQTELASATGDMATLKARIEQNDAHRERIVRELEELQRTCQQNEREIDEQQTRLRALEVELGQLAERRDELSRLREQYDTMLKQVRSEWQSSHQKNSVIMQQHEMLKSRRDLIRETVMRMEQRGKALEERAEVLDAKIAECVSRLPELEQELESGLRRVTETEQHLSQARDNLDCIQKALSELESQRMQQERNVQSLQEGLEQARIAAGEHRVKADSLGVQLAELGYEPEKLLEKLGSDDGQEEWQHRLVRIRGRIDRLGPVNLAAIDEFDELSERRDYLDAQLADLNSALDTLQGAIKKIDKETRSRFEQTYNQLNINMGKLFPRLFGGGEARLSLVGDDLLDAGVSITVCLPGKRSSSIHLLSGGEKALTAVALVFSIFQLNPAPFCVLDEADAPLDDVNIGRFCELLQSMSDDVQFIFVSHNKLTMEIAQRLIGVTMQEAGVSRLVAVDMEQTLQAVANA